MSARRRAVLIALAAAALPRVAAPCSTTGCVLVARGEAATVPAGEWRFDLTLRQSDQDRGLYGHEAIAVSGDPDPPTLRPLVDDETGRLSNNYHQERALRARVAQVDVSRGLTSRLTLVLSVPAFSERRVEHDVFAYTHDPNHRDENVAGDGGQVGLTTAGIGDVQLNARYLLRRGLIGTLGVQVPTGDDDRVDEFGRRADPMLQPGTGAFALLAGVALVRRIEGLGATWTASATYQRNTESARGYRFGDDAFVLATLARAIHGPLGAALSVKALHTGRSTFHGVASASTGGRAVYVAPSLRLRAPGNVGLFGTVHFPLYQHVNESQLGARVIFTAGLSVAP
jgi:hypothetical protein